MSAPTRIFVDIFRQKIVAGFSSIAPVTLAPFYYGEKRDLNIALLEPNPDTGGQHPVPYAYVSLADIGLKVSITDIGTGVIVPVVYQNAFTVSADGHFFVGTLDLNQPAVATALGSNESFSKYFEIVQDKSGVLTPYYQQQITVRARGTSGLTAVPGPQDTPVSREYVDAGFCPRQRPAGWFEIWTDANGVQYKVFMGVDGQITQQPLA